MISTSNEWTLMTVGVSRRIREDKTLEDAWRYEHRYYSGDEDKRQVEVCLHDLSIEQVQALRKLAKSCNLPKLVKICDALLDPEIKVPNFEAALGIIANHLRNHLTMNGWLYKRGADGQVYPYMVDGISRHDPDKRDRDDYPYVGIRLTSKSIGSSGDNSRRWGRGEQYSSNSTIHLRPSDMIHKAVPDILERNGYMLETEELQAEYLAQIQHYLDHVRGRFAEQFRFDRTENVKGVKCIMDTEDDNYDKVIGLKDICPVVTDDGEPNGIRVLPVHPMVRIFRLDDHEFELVNAVRLIPYEYDKSLANKLILPESHMDILDILTTNTDEFLADIIEGKSAGNVILCKGIPGIGKTLTAEVYSELIGKPIYNVHSGALGVGPDTVEKNLRTIFECVSRWDCILLLDEADVFVGERGANLNQNAIVSVFLRVLEYFTGLMFMTTNRSDNIDDAIISRCAAIIDYGVPNRSDTMAIWHVMAAQNDIELSETLVVQLLDAFPSVTPRDIKHLLRMTVRVAKSRDVELSEDLFRMCAQFRNVHIEKKKAIAHSSGVPVRRRKRPGTTEKDI